MRRKMLNASQLQQEVNRRIHRLQEIVEDGVKIRVPRPQLQEPDKTGCNWNMTHFGNPCRRAALRANQSSPHGPLILHEAPSRS
jgi:hypothetical protein